MPYESNEEAVAKALSKAQLSTGGTLPEPPPMGESMLPSGTYAGKVVVITGGGGGLGRGFAREFARLGATVGIVSRNPENTARGVAAVEEVGGTAIEAQMDVRNPDEIAAAFDAIEARAGAVDVLLNNAAGNIPGPAEDLSPGAFKAVSGIVLEGTYNCSRELARRALGAKRPAAILNIGAHTVWTGGAGQALSAAAKAGVHNLALSLAVEWAPYGIRVNTLVPGMFPQNDLKIDVVEAICANAGIPGGRWGRLQELCWAATYLCSPYASYITGATLVVDGANWQQRGPNVGGTFTPVRDQLGLPAYGEDYDPVALAAKKLSE